MGSKEPDRKHGGAIIENCDQAIVVTFDVKHRTATLQHAHLRMRALHLAGRRPLIRVYHDLKQNELADKLKISKSYLSEIESGAKVPTLALVEGYAKEFNIPASAILFFSESIDDLSSANRAREFVSKKIIALLRFIEERSENKGGKRKSHLSS